MNKKPNWYYNELQQVGVDYSKIEEVEVYDANMKKLRDVKKEVEIIKAALNINPGQRILEIGTGTGELAIELAQYSHEVIAIDISETMLEFARDKAIKRGISNLSFYQGGFLTYEHQGEAFDAVITQLALHHLTDFWKMIALRRIYQMLNEGGQLYLRDVVFPSKLDSYESFFGEVISNVKTFGGDKMAEETEVHIREEYSTLDWIMEGLLKDAGFTIEKANYYDGFMASYVCRK